MCKYYAHKYTCKHTTYALGKYCHEANLIQKPCAKKSIWQILYMGEACADCAVPPFRGGDVAAGGEEEVVKERGTGEGGNATGGNGERGGKSGGNGERGGRSANGGGGTGGGSGRVAHVGGKGRRIKRR